MRSSFKRKVKKINKVFLITHYKGSHNSPNKIKKREKKEKPAKSKPQNGLGKN
jgi:hypothetical protein